MYSLEMLIYGLLEVRAHISAFQKRLGEGDMATDVVFVKMRVKEWRLSIWSFNNCKEL